MIVLLLYGIVILAAASYYGLNELWRNAPEGRKDEVDSSL
jgi:hypothetical protein